MVQFTVLCFNTIYYILADTYNTHYFLFKPCKLGERYGLSCYYLVNETMDWVSAKNNCEMHGYHLVTITSAGENDFVARLVQKQMGMFNVREKIYGYQKSLPQIYIPF